MSILSIMVRRFSLFIGGFILITPFLALAGFQPVKIVTRPGVATPYVQFDIDLSKVPEGCVNPDVKVVIVAKNAERTADRFDYVGLYDNAGKRQRMPFGRNVASKTDALSATPYSFTFHNFGITAADIQNIGGIEVSFVSAGGENSTGLAIITGLSASVDCEVGDECVIPDPITIVTPEKPPITIKDIQQVRPLVQPGTHGTGDSGGSCSPTSSGPNSPGTMANDSSVGTKAWSNMDSAKISDNAYAATASILGVATSNYLKATDFGFAIPEGSTINGITVEVEKAMTGATSISDNAVRIVKGGTIGSTEMKAAGDWPTTDAYTTYGSSSSLWGETWTANEINGIAFGFVLSAVATGYPGIVPRVDHIRITVNYTATECASVYSSFMDLARTISKKIFCRIDPSSACKK